MKQDQIILNPLVTEKTAIAESNGKYIFRVLSKTNKNEVKKAIERIFNVKVEEVNMLITKSKKKRRGRIIGKVSGFKKAIITLKKGDKIKLREEKKETKKKVGKAEKKETVAEKKVETEKE